VDFSNSANKGGSNLQLENIGESVSGSGIIFRSSAPNYVGSVGGVSTYTGPTEAAVGTLRVNAGGSIASSPKVILDFGATLDVTQHTTGYDIAANQRLTGDGSWTGRILMDGTLAPGTNSLGVLAGNDFTLQGTAKMQFDLSTFDSNSDKLTLTGAFDKGSAGPFVFDFAGTGAVGQTYSLVQFLTTTLAPTDFTATNLAPGLFATFQLTPNELQLVVIPEPGATLTLLVGLGYAGLAGRFRRKGMNRSSKAQPSA
jgi:hypothetical protein